MVLRAVSIETKGAKRECWMQNISRKHHSAGTDADRQMVA